MSRFMRKALTVGLLTILLSVAAACSSGGGSNDGSSAGSAGNGGNSPSSGGKAVTVEFWVFDDWATGEAGDQFKTYISEFEAANPGIKIKLVGKPDSQIKSGIITGASSGVLPDAFTIALNSAYSLAQSGAVKDITEQWNGESDEYKAQFTPSIAQSLNVDGKVWGLPMTGWSTVLYRNLMALKQAGIDPSQGVKDWADWLDQMKRLKDAGVDATFALSTDPWFVYNFLGGVDGAKIDVQDGKVTLTEEQLTSAYQFMKDASAYVNQVPRSDPTADDLFISGKVAFNITGPWPYVNYEKAKSEGKLDYDFVQLPAQTAGRNGGVHGGEFLGITNGKNSDAAYQWIRFLADKQQMSRFAAQMGRLIYNDEAMKDATVMKNDLVQAQVKALAGGVNDAAYFKPLPGDLKAFTDGANAVVTGKKTPEEAAKETIDALNKQIKDAE